MDNTGRYYYLLFLIAALHFTRMTAFPWFDAWSPSSGGIIFYFGEVLFLKLESVQLQSASDEKSNTFVSP